MLEAYTTLGYLAAQHLAGQAARLGHRGRLPRARAARQERSPRWTCSPAAAPWLGIGAAWNGEEARGLGLFFPPTAERFERLEETLQICLQMWSDDDGPYEGKHYQLERTLNSPQALRRPHPPILIGGGGEKKTLRLVAQYADACNLFAVPELAHKLDVLRGHCADVGRDYDEIEKTVMVPLDPGANGEKVDELLDELRRLADLGVSKATGRVPAVETITPLEIRARRCVPGRPRNSEAPSARESRRCTCCTVCTARFRCARAVPVCTRARASHHPARGGWVGASAHRLLAVDRLPDDVGVPGVLGGLGRRCAATPGGPSACAGREPRRRRQRVGHVQIGRLRPARRSARRPSRTRPAGRPGVSSGSSLNPSATRSRRPRACPVITPSPPGPPRSSPSPARSRRRA